MACRKDGKGRVLRKGEGYRKGDGRYSYVYVDPLGKKRTIYAKSLVKLREREEQLQKDQLELESCLLDRKKEQILLTLTEKSKYLQDLLNRKNVTIIDRMEIARLENECQLIDWYGSKRSRSQHVKRPVHRR